MIVNDQELRDGTRFLFFARGPLPSGKWELTAKIIDPDGKLLDEYVYEILFDSQKQAEAAFPRLQRTFGEHLARLGIETSPIGIA